MGKHQRGTRPCLAIVGMATIEGSRSRREDHLQTISSPPILSHHHNFGEDLQGSQNQMGMGGYKRGRTGRLNGNRFISDHRYSKPDGRQVNVIGTTAPEIKSLGKIRPTMLFKIVEVE